MKDSRGKRRPSAGCKRASHPQTVLRIAATPAEKTRIEEALSTRHRTEVLMCTVREVEQAVPPGCIRRWHGPIPDGWLLCDGSDGTPDLRSKFIIGVDENKEFTMADGSTYLRIYIVKRETKAS